MTVCRRARQLASNRIPSKEKARRGWMSALRKKWLEGSSFGVPQLGQPPFPTKEAPAHKKHRKRRLVVDYRRVNARVLRSTYYCRKATDVLAQCSGSIWYSFVDAVTGFNQIQNTRRAMEVLAIVARSGKFLPVCLTFQTISVLLLTEPLARAAAERRGSPVIGPPMWTISRSERAG